MSLSIMRNQQKTVTIVRAPGTGSETRTSVKALIQSNSGMFDIATQIYEGDIVEVDDPRGFVDHRIVGAVKVNDIGSAQMHHIHVEWAPKPAIASSQKGTSVTIPKVFISHASADREVADALKDLLQLGGLSAGNIFYSSDRGTGIETGSDLRSRLRVELRDAAVVIELLTETFMQRAVCLMELGGAWALGKPTYPIVVPPYTFAAASVHIGEIIMASLGTPAQISDLLHELPAVLKGADDQLIVEFEPRHVEHFKQRLSAALSTAPPGGTSFSVAPTVAGAGGQADSVYLLKSWIRDPTKTVELEDLVDRAVTTLAKHTREVVNVESKPSSAGRDLVDHYQGLLEATRPVIELLQVGIRYDRARTHDHVWVDVIRNLMRARRPVPFGVSYNSRIEQSRHLPALYALRAAGTAALMHNADDLFIKLFTQPTWRDEKPSRDPAPTNRRRPPRVRAL